MMRASKKESRMKETVIKALETAVERLKSGKWWVAGASIDVDDVDMQECSEEGGCLCYRTRNHDRMTIEVELLSKEE